MYEAKDYETLAKEFSVSAEEVESSLNSAKEKMFRWRNENRPRPHLDNKFIASWNGKLPLNANMLNANKMRNTGHLSLLNCINVQD